MKLEVVSSSFTSFFKHFYKHSFLPRGPHLVKPILQGVTTLSTKANKGIKQQDSWLHSLTLSSNTRAGENSNPHSASSRWVLGIDPDISGALALLKTEDFGYSPNVFDSPVLKVLVGTKIRRRLDTNSVVDLIKSFDAPLGTVAYIEQSMPLPQDGKQSWWGGGFNYGLWIGVLVALGYSVVPVPSATWKNKFGLCGSTTTKDDSRRLASTLFPSLSYLLQKKKDHGRAEALLIAAYGKDLQTSEAL